MFIQLNKEPPTTQQQTAVKHEDQFNRFEHSMKYKELSIVRMRGSVISPRISNQLDWMCMLQLQQRCVTNIRRCQSEQNKVLQQQSRSDPKHQSETPGIQHLYCDVSNVEPRRADLGIAPHLSLPISGDVALVLLRGEIMMGRCGPHFSFPDTSVPPVLLPVYNQQCLPHQTHANEQLLRRLLILH